MRPPNCRYQVDGRYYAVSPAAAAWLPAGKSNRALNICFPARAERCFAVLFIVDAKVLPARFIKLTKAKGMFQAAAKVPVFRFARTVHRAKRKIPRSYPRADDSACS